MEDLLKQLLVENSIAESKTTTNTISKLIDNTRIIGLANSISATKKQILEIFNMYKQSEDFKEKHIAIDNANAKREYEYFFNANIGDELFDEDYVDFWMYAPSLPGEPNGDENA